MRSREFQRLSDTDRKLIEPLLGEYPVKLGQIANLFGITINVSNMEVGVSGQIKRDGGNYIIRVNRNEARERQRFTVAHELAHYFLHKDIIDNSADGITDTVLYRSGKSEQIEYEANRLAADIVMPLKIIERVLLSEFNGIITEQTIESLAAKFQVSKVAMEIRLSIFVDT